MEGSAWKNHFAELSLLFSDVKCSQTGVLQFNLARFSAGNQPLPWQERSSCSSSKSYPILFLIRPRFMPQTSGYAVLPELVLWLCGVLYDNRKRWHAIHCSWFTNIYVCHMYVCNELWGEKPFPWKIPRKRCLKWLSLGQPGCTWSSNLERLQEIWKDLICQRPRESSWWEATVF